MTFTSFHEQIKSLLDYFDEQLNDKKFCIFVYKDIASDNNRIEILYNEKKQVLSISNQTLSSWSYKELITFIMDSELVMEARVIIKEKLFKEELSKQIKEFLDE